MRHFPSLCAFLLSLAPAAGAEAPTPSLAILLTPERVKAAQLDTLAPVLAVGPRGTVVVAEPNNLFAVSRRKFLFDTPTPVSDCAYTPDGALLVISGRTLGYCAGGRFHPQIDLPEDAMRLAIGQDRVYVYGADRDKATSIYVIDPQYGHAKLCTVPSAVGAAAAVGATLYFSMANDIYRLVPGGEINLVCHLPGPAITSLAAGADETLYFLAGRTLYAWQPGQVGIIGEGVGDIVCRQGGALYILHVAKQVLIKLGDLPEPGATVQQMP